MSSSSSGAIIHYWCYTCNEPIMLELGDATICPYCYEGFVQELNNHVPPSSYHHHMRVDSGDYFVGSTGGLEELIEQLSMNDESGGGGATPAPSSSINAMPSIKITRSHLRSDSKCPICQEDFELGSEAKAMQCNHIFHSDCIVLWLAQHNSCPVCRVHLPPP